MTYTPSGFPGGDSFAGLHKRLPLMRELAIADFRQLTEGEKTYTILFFLSPSQKSVFNQPIFDSPLVKGGQGRMKVEQLDKLKLSFCAFCVV